MTADALPTRDDPYASSLQTLVKKMSGGWDVTSPSGNKYDIVIIGPPNTTCAVMC